MAVERPNRSPSYIVLGDDDVAVIPRFRVVAEVGNLSLSEGHARSSDRSAYVDPHVDEPSTAEQICVVHVRADLVVLADTELGLWRSPCSSAQVEDGVVLRQVDHGAVLVDGPVDHGLAKKED
mgnify:CR=1 FL=1